MLNKQNVKPHGLKKNYLPPDKVTLPHKRFITPLPASAGPTRDPISSSVKITSRQAPCSGERGGLFLSTVCAGL